MAVSEGPEYFSSAPMSTFTIDLGSVRWPDGSQVRIGDVIVLQAMTSTSAPVACPPGWNVFGGNICWKVWGPVEERNVTFTSVTTHWCVNVALMTKGGVFRD